VTLILFARAVLRKSAFILREEGLRTWVDRARRALIVRVKRVFQDKSANTARWRGLKGRYAGRRVFLVGNGPSLNRTPLHLLKGECTMCFNRFSLMFERLSWRPSFYATTDDRVLADIAPELNAVVPQVELAFFPDLHPYNVDFRDRILARDNVYWLWLDRLGFSDDLPYCGMNKTVANVALQVLAYLGFREIYLLGVDMDYREHVSAARHNARDWTATRDDDPNHFDPRYFGVGRQYHHPRMDETLAKFREAKDFFDARGVYIANAGVGGKLEVFPRAEFRSLFSVGPLDELRLLLEPLGVVPVTASLRGTFPSAVDVRAAAAWRESAELVIAPLEVALALIREVVFTHVPIGPFRDEYLFVRRDSTLRQPVTMGGGGSPSTHSG